jgi:hypothetical protein
MRADRGVIASWTSPWALNRSMRSAGVARAYGRLLADARVAAAAPGHRDPGGNLVLTYSLASWSVAGSSGIGGAVEEVGEQLELVVVAGAELVHRGVHTCIEAEQLGVGIDGP